MAGDLVRVWPDRVRVQEQAANAGPLLGFTQYYRIGPRCANSIVTTLV